MQNYTKLAVIATVIFMLVSLNPTYTATSGILGPLVGQTGADYGDGNRLTQRGFLIHSLIFFLVMYMILKKQVK